MGRCYEYIKGAHHSDDIASLTNKEIVSFEFPISMLYFKNKVRWVLYRLGVARPFLMLKALFLTLPRKSPSQHWRFNQIDGTN
jgi:hypothetical protein